MRKVYTLKLKLKPLTISLILFLSIGIGSMLNAQDWTQVGSDIIGDDVDQAFGSSISISADGSIMAIGAPESNYYGSEPYVKICENFNGSWWQIGNNIISPGTVRFGKSVSLSADGSIVAILSEENVRVYRNIFHNWIQIGSSFEYAYAEDVSMSPDGSTIAIAAGDLIYIYKNINDTWTQLGNNIQYSAWASSVSLSSDGLVVAIGAHGDGTLAPEAGSAAVYKYANDTWEQVGTTLYGRERASHFGYDIDVSSDGSIVAIGSYGKTGKEEVSSNVRIYKNINDTWTQIGTDIIGGIIPMSFPYLPYSVSLNADGSIMAVSEFEGANHVSIYQNQNDTWVQLGTDISGEGGSSVSLSANGLIVAAGNEDLVRVYKIELPEPSPTITSQPVDHTNIIAGNNVSFSVVGTDIASYQWQVDEGSGFVAISNGGVYSNATTATLNITGITLAMNNYQYRCYVENVSGSATSDAATLTIMPNAPTPTPEARDVVSVYSDAYAINIATNINPNWNQATIVTEHEVESNKFLEYEFQDIINKDYQGLEYNTTDVSNLDYLHFDYWTNDASILKFYLISNGETYYDVAGSDGITTGTWVSVDIPLSYFADFGRDLTQAIQFKTVGNGTIYFDNLYFWREPAEPGADASLEDITVSGESIADFSPIKLNYNVDLAYGTTVVPQVIPTTYDSNATYVITDATSIPGTTTIAVTSQDETVTEIYSISFVANLPVTAAPTPTIFESNIISVYSDAYTSIATNLNPGWGQATNFSEIQLDGDNTLRYADLNYQGMDFPDPTDVSGMDYVHFDYWTLDATQFQFFLITNGETRYNVKVKDGITLGSWVSIDIPLSYFSTAGLDLTQASQFKTVGNGTIYMDNLYFYRINKETPTVTEWPTATDITYGEDLSSASLSGGAASVAGSFAYDDNTITPNAGNYSAAITFTPTDETNYNTVAGNIDVTVNTKAITVTANANQTKVYGEADPTLTYATDVALVSGDAFSGALAREAGEDVNTYAILQGTLELNSNYTITFEGDDFTVTAKAITVTANTNQTKVYGEVDPTLTYATDVALVSGDAFSGALAREAGEDVNTYAITQGDLALNSNYNLSFTGADFEITKATPTVTAWPTTGAITYGDVLSTANLVGGTASTAGSFDYTDGSERPNAGTNNFDVVFTPADNTNYNSVSGNVSVAVAKAMLTATADDQIRKEGEDNPTLTVTLTGFVLGEDESYVFELPQAACSADASSVAGDYPITVSGGSDNNYDFYYVTGNLTIETATAIAPAEKVIGKVWPNPTSGQLFISNQLIGKEYAIYSLTGSIVMKGASADSTLNLSNLDNGVYMVVIEGAVFRVVKK